MKRTNSPRDHIFYPRPTLHALGEQEVISCLKTAFAALPKEQQATIRRYAERTRGKFAKGIGLWSVLRMELVMDPQIVAGLDELDAEVEAYGIFG